VVTSIDVPNARVTEVYDINPKGEVVGRYWDGNGVSHGVLLSGGVFTDLDPSPPPS